MSAKQRRETNRRLFVADENDAIAVGSCTYDPLPSVWYGSDAELLERMLKFYPHRPPKDILDATVNAGRFWRGSNRQVVGMDIDPRFAPDIVANNCNMPCEDASFDVIVYDPPHVPNQGKDRSKDFNDRFGLTLKSLADNGITLPILFGRFFGKLSGFFALTAWHSARLRTTYTDIGINGHMSN